jgi:signal peptidase I
MTILEWILILIVLSVLNGFATWKFYKNAGVPAWKAFVPFYAFYALMQVINRPKWWTIFVFIPIVNLLFFPVLWVQIIDVFGKRKNKDRFLAALSFGLYPAYLNYTEADKMKYENEHTELDTLVGSMIFAIIAATIVHTYIMQPYTIPTGSLEKSLLIGDYLFVSKFHYGARTPMTTIAMPMVHDTIPLLKKRSYLKSPQLPYFRFPGFQKIKKNDIVVFNWPADTVFQFGETLKTIPPQYKPIDKKSHYVKRCVGVAGDTLQIKNSVVYVNGKKLEYPDRTEIQKMYTIKMKKNKLLSTDIIYNKLLFDKEDGFYKRDSTLYYVMKLTEKELSYIKGHQDIESVEVFSEVSKGGLYSNNPEWSINNFGPIYIPKKGDVITLNKKTYPIYKWIISRYDDHDAGHKIDKHKVVLKGDDVYIDGKLTKEYTVKQDYYWMMGDNRFNSEDSRYWGFVPFDHVVGKPVFIFFSKGAEGIRWNRVFTTVSGSGERVSYLIPFVVLLLIYFGYSKYKEKKKTV